MSDQTQHDDGERSDTDAGHHIDADAGGRAHTSVQDGDPALEGSRSARDVGGPSLAPEDVDAAPDTTGGAKGDIRTKGMEAHE